MDDLTLQSPLFYGLTAIDMAVLLAVGLCWSWAIWAIAEGFKARIPQIRGSGWMTWCPVVASTLGALGAFPAALDGVLDTHISPTPLLFAVSAALGLLGGFGAKAIHATVGDWMMEAAAAVRRRIRGIGPGEDGGT